MSGDEAGLRARYIKRWRGTIGSVLRMGSGSTSVPIMFVGICLLAVGGVLGACGGGDSSSSGGEIVIQGEGDILLEPAGSAGPESFAGEVHVVRGPTTTFSIPGTSTTQPQTTLAPGQVTAWSGGTPGLYGGSRNKAVCDKEAQLRFLEENPDKAAAFVAALNSDPTLRWSGGNQVRPDQLRAYFAELTPLVLTRDTRVTNHGFRNGRPTPRQSVLQAGQGVLVDSYGVPRVRCECGNPLIPPQPVKTTPTYTGPRWPGFDPTTVIIIQQTTVIINIFVVIDVQTGEIFDRPPGTSGEEDVPQEGVTTTGATITGSTTTTEAGDARDEVPVPGRPLFEASLRNGDYGSGKAIPTMDPERGASPDKLGIVDSPDGVTFTSTETDGRSNALINWEMGGDRQFRQTGVIAFSIRVDRATFVPGELWGDNYGYTKFNNGQGTISAGAALVENGAGAGDDQVRVHWHSWHNSEWFPIEGTVIDFGNWHRLAFAWGGSNDFELWVDGRLAHSADLPSDMSLPWGSDDLGSAANVGLGSNHQRGYQSYGSVAGVTFVDIKIWNEYVPGASASRP